MTQEDVLYYLPFAKEVKTLAEAFKLFQKCETAEDPIYPKTACLDDPGKELFMHNFNGESVVASIYEHYTNGLRLNLGNRYFKNIEEASRYMFQLAFATDAMNAIDKSEEDQKAIIKRWKTLANYIRLFIEKELFLMSVKVKILEDIVSECPSLSINVETMRKHSKRIAEKYADEFENKMGKSFLWFDYHNPEHWRWALSKMEPSYVLAP